MDPPSEALPSIWENWDEFAGLFKALNEQAAALEAAASDEADPQGAVKTAFNGNGRQLSDLSHQVPQRTGKELSKVRLLMTRRGVIWTVIALGVIGLGILVYLLTSYPVQTRSLANLTGSKERGAYVIRLAGCIACHSTSRDWRWLSVRRQTDRHAVRCLHRPQYHTGSDQRHWIMVP